MLSMLLAVAPFTVADTSRIVDIDADKGIVVVDITTDKPSDAACDNRELGGHGELVVVDGHDVRVVAGFDKHPACATKASAAKARADAKKAVASHGLDLDRKNLDVTPLSSTGALRMETVGNDVDNMHFERTHLLSGDAILWETSTQWAGGSALPDTDTSFWLVKVRGAAFLVEETHFVQEGSAARSYKIFGPIVLPTNGVDVARIRALPRPAACSASIASNGALVDTVARTLASALGEGTVVTTAKAERATSVVYATPACKDVASALAATFLGGATVEALTWKSTSGVVVALGASATPKLMPTK